ncbi:ABC transporter ATP-binding protein [Bacillus cereus]|uniref:ABC transporter ATP-binding protein n=1 Tax=Bacillus cereus TaxID=1396 RepID=UPI0030130E58
MDILSVKNLSKIYEDKVVLNKVNLSIGSGEFVALNGENGAGKSTTLQCIMGMTIKDSGEIYVSQYNMDTNPIKAKKIIGFSPDEPFLYPYLSGLEHLKLWAGFRNLNQEDIEYGIKLLNDLGLGTKDLNNFTSTYSKGMRQKIGFIGSIFHRPTLIILDEPFTAMDQKSTDTAIQMLKSFKQDGCSILFSSHQQEIKDQLADRFLILKDGDIH